MEKASWFKKYLFDILLGLLVVIISISLMLALFLKKTNDNLYAVIYYHNEVYDKIDLSNVEEEKTKTYNFDGKEVVIIYSHNKIRVKSADCHDHTCEKMGETSSPNKPIVCMDIGFMIKIETNSEALDVVVG